MPVSVVVGGQYGSEGKGKVALALARREGGECIAVRVGGPNSGHTGYDLSGRRWILRQLPVAAIDGAYRVILPAGSYIQPEILLSEITQLGLSDKEVVISPQARLITPEHILHERQSGIGSRIGSTATGTGAAVLSALQRADKTALSAAFAPEDSRLHRYLGSTTDVLRCALGEGRRVIIEGTQGFGLSPLHSPHWPNVTSRDTTAAAFVSETGLSPLDVDDITLVVRAWPIRVAGASGPLEEECDWATVSRESGSPEPLCEFTSVTNRVRRVGRFNSDLVRAAISVNQPTRLVLNHLDHVDWRCQTSSLTNRNWDFIHFVERGLGRHVDWVGTGVDTFVELGKAMALRA